MTGDVGRAEHLSTDATGDLAFVPDHVGAESVFGGESRGTGLQLYSSYRTRVNEMEEIIKKNNRQKTNKKTGSEGSYRYLAFKWSF